MMDDFEIWLVDDDEVTNFIHDKLISKSGLPVPSYTFEDGHSALNHVDKEKHNTKTVLLLLDINMPGMNSWDFLDELEKYSFDLTIWVVIITSSVAQSDKTKSMNYSRIIDFYEKPIDKDTLDKIKKHTQLEPFFQ